MKSRKLADSSLLDKRRLEGVSRFSRWLLQGWNETSLFQCHKKFDFKQNITKTPPKISLCFSLQCRGFSSSSWVIIIKIIDMINEKLDMSLCKKRLGFPTLYHFPPILEDEPFTFRIPLYLICTLFTGLSVPWGWTCSKAAILAAWLRCQMLPRLWNYSACLLVAASWLSVVLLSGSSPHPSKEPDNDSQHRGQLSQRQRTRKLSVLRLQQVMKVKGWSTVSGVRWDGFDFHFHH